MRIAPRALLVLLSLSAGVVPAHLIAQDPIPATIQGTVLDSVSALPLEGARVSIADLGLAVETDPSGTFRLSGVPPGQHMLAAELFGYASQEEWVIVSQGSTVTLTLALAVAPFEAAPLEISVEGRDYGLEISGFYDRLESTSGTFITREDVEDRQPTFTTDLFRGIPGTRVVGGLGFGAQTAVVLQGSRALSLMGSNDLNQAACYPAIWIDGMMVHSGSAGMMGDDPAFMDDLIRPDQIAGVEVYSSAARIPVQFNLYSACGVVVFWTRQGDLNAERRAAPVSGARSSTRTGAPTAPSGGTYVFPLDPGERIRIRTSPIKSYTGTFMRLRSGEIIMRTTREQRVPITWVRTLEVEEGKNPLITLAGTLVGAGIGIGLAVGTDLGISGNHEVQGKLLEPGFGALVGGITGGLISWHFFGKRWREVPLGLDALPDGPAGGTEIGVRIPWPTGG